MRLLYNKKLRKYLIKNKKSCLIKIDKCEKITKRLQQLSGFNEQKLQKPVEKLQKKSFFGEK